MSHSTEETLDAVVGSARASEAGRRVGWAKAYQAERRASDAERAVNMARVDNKLIARFAARAYGALVVIVDKRIAQLFRGDHYEVQSYLPQGAFNQGLDDGRRIIAGRHDHLTRLREDIKALEGGYWEMKQTFFNAAKQKALDELCAEYGFASRDALYAFLSTYQP